MLVHDGDARVLRIQRRVKRNRFAIHRDMTLIGLVNAGKEFNARALARAIFAQQRQNFTGNKVQRYVAERRGATKGLGSLAETGNRRGGIARGENGHCLHLDEPR
jgi:hypothetical protein